MHVVILTEPGKLELNYMWLPTWIGISKNLLDQVSKELSEVVVGLPVTEDNLDEIHNRVIELIQSKCKVKGLSEYLHGIKAVSWDSPD